MPPKDLIARLYDEHAQAIFHFLLHLSGNEADTKDVLSELFQKIIRNPEIMDGVEDERPFLIRVAHNLFRDQWRRRETRARNYDQFQEEEASLFAEDTHPDENTFRVALSIGLKKLPEDQRAVLSLKLWQGFTFEQIAETLEISPNTAASRYRYGLDKLQEELRPFYEEIKNERSRV